LNYLFLIICGITPSLLWLLYFLRKDVHPEDNRQVFKVFVFGFLSVAPAALIQYGIVDILRFWPASIWKTIFIVFCGVALIEELIKYLVVKGKVMQSSHFDEPTDLPLYLIISALGFAAAENILFIIGPNILAVSAARTVVVSLARSVSAVLLHTLASGTLGIFLVLSYGQPKFHLRLITLGFVLAVFLHGLYNFSIMVVEGNVRFLLPFLILINLALVLSLGFKKISELKSVCEIK